MRGKILAALLSLQTALAEIEMESTEGHHAKQVLLHIETSLLVEDDFRTILKRAASC